MGIFVLISITAILAFLDLIVKAGVENGMDQGEERTALGGRLIFRKVYNKGFCLNLLEKKEKIVRWVSTVVTVFFTIWYLAVLMRRKRHMQKAGLSLVTAGAWSNTFDRLVRGYVIDYLGIQTKNEKTTGITFNLGDVYIGAGSVLLILWTLFHPGKKKM